MKVGPKPPGHHPHGLHKAHPTGGHKQVRGKKIDTLTPDAELDEVDAMAPPLQAKADTGQQDSHGEHQSQQKQLTQPKALELTFAEPQLHALVQAMCDQLDELATELTTTAPGPKLQQVKTTSALKDILRQVMTGDFGMQLTKDANASLGKLFKTVKRWPTHVPPGKKPPWDEDEWDAFLAWLNEPPTLPPPDQLL